MGERRTKVIAKENPFLPAGFDPTTNIFLNPQARQPVKTVLKAPLRKKFFEVYDLPSKGHPSNEMSNLEGSESFYYN